MRNYLYILLLLSLTSCSVRTQYYLRNLLDVPVEVILTLDTKYERIPEYLFSYTDEILKIKFDSHQNFSKSIKGDLNGNKIYFSIPPRSILFVTEGSSVLGTFEEVTIKVNGRSHQILKDGLIDQNKANTKKNRKALGLIAVWTDIDKSFQ